MKKRWIYCFILFSLFCFVLPVLAEDEGLSLPTGQSQVLRLEKVQRVAVANPTVADVVVVSASEVLVNGLQPGTTTLHIWMASGYKRLMLKVYDDTSTLTDQIREAINNPQITVTKVKNTLILKGTVATEQDKAEVLAIAGSFGDKIVDLITVKQTAQVLIRTYVLEMNRDKIRELGLEWGEFQRGVFAPQQMLFGQFNINGALGQLNPLGTQLKIFEEQNLSRTLAAPELLAVSGQKANIHVGGEIPVITPNDIIWKPYGILMTVEPQVLNNGEIRMVLEPEVSTFDWDNGIKHNGIEYPAFKTRKVKTTLTVMSGSTIVLGGLINQDDTSKVKKVPFLGDLPLIGELFRSTKFRKGESEVVVLVQAWIVTEEMLNNMQIEKQPFIEEHQLELEDAMQEVQEAK